MAQTLPLVIALVGVVGILDNGLLIVTWLVVKSMRAKETLLVFLQAVIDLISSILLLGIYAPEIQISRTEFRPKSADEEPTIWHEVYCKLWVSRYFFWLVRNISNWNLVLLAVERFLAILCPFFYEKRFSYKAAATAWSLVAVASAALVLPEAMYTTWRNGTCIPYDYPCNTGLLITLAYFIIEWALVILIILVCYLSLFVRVLIMASQGQQLDATANNCLVAFFLAFLGFLACTSLAAIIFFGQMFRFYLHGVPPTFFNTPLYHVSVVLTNVACIINPIVYAFRYKRFQAGVRTLFRRSVPVCVTRVHPVPAPSSNPGVVGTSIQLQSTQSNSVPAGCSMKSDTRTSLNTYV